MQQVELVPFFVWYETLGWGNIKKLIMVLVLTILQEFEKEDVEHLDLGGVYTRFTMIFQQLDSPIPIILCCSIESAVLLLMFESNNEKFLPSFKSAWFKFIRCLLPAFHMTLFQGI